MGKRLRLNTAGPLVDGREFDNSEKQGGTVKFTVGQVVPGWTEALKMMNKGSKWQLFIPSKLGYGERGAGGLIGPNATLIFDVELIDIKPGAAPEGMQMQMPPQPEPKK